ncbi:hypothetical protein DPMN_100692 [Dreissena polymorpha]|uniref:Uncharacterized protein n=1 Tax=Dreissena polymorpha TaxID=45954 RepID=A0A9D4R8F4_DREPO|nr:hypothetical protein DPMN_100692 [Dreissena polymorpha]
MKLHHKPQSNSPDFDSYFCANCPNRVQTELSWLMVSDLHHLSVGTGWPNKSIVGSNNQICET